MKIKSIFSAILTLTFAVNSVLAVSYTSVQEQLTSKSPIYLLVELGNSSLGAERSYSGAIAAAGGKISVAKEILIDSNESLTGDEGEIGEQNSVIDFHFSTPFYKGLILKVFPNQDFSNEVGTAQYGKLDFIQRVGQTNKTVLTVPYSSLLEKGFYSGGDYRVRSIYFDKNATLEQRNEVFRAKLEVAGKIQVVLRWARTALQEGLINDSIYRKFDDLARSSWQISRTDTAYFNWRFKRLKTYFANEKATPELFYGGLSQLMKKYLP